VASLHRFRGGNVAGKLGKRGKIEEFESDRRYLRKSEKMGSLSAVGYHV